MGVTVSDLLNKKGFQVFGLTPGALVFDALQLLAEKNIGALLVLDSDSLVGVFSERDYARKMALHGKYSRNTSVKEVMTREVVTVTLEDSIEHCMDLMTRRHIRHLPVTENGKVVGVISIGDIVKEIISDQQSTIGQLNEYITRGR
jgi:CBS domain-containing protein